MSSRIRRSPRNRTPQRISVRLSNRILPALSETIRHMRVL
jgi:hypothetical protein